MSSLNSYECTLLLCQYRAAGKTYFFSPNPFVFFCLFHESFLSFPVLLPLPLFSMAFKCLSLCYKEKEEEKEEETDEEGKEEKKAFKISPILLQCFFSFMHAGCISLSLPFSNSSYLLFLLLLQSNQSKKYTQLL